MARDEALHSASIVERQMTLCSQLVQMTGQLEMQITKPVQLFMQDGSVLSSWGQRLAKLASTQTLMSKEPEGQQHQTFIDCTFEVLTDVLKSQLMGPLWIMGET